ncbi:MAG: TetR/AcrR family transcriptional regulator [Anaerolineales bacterium]|nr:TetR/AcrR family transcriptional regulator [Anaerolineales bacterium]
MPELTSRQEEIINAAIHIIAEQSAHELSMRSVADRVGFSEPALYRHFENKDDLLLKLISYITQNIKSVMQKRDDPGKPALEQLEEMLGYAMKNYSDRWPFTTTLYATGMFYTNPDLLDEFLSLIETSITSIKDSVERGQEEGTVNELVTSTQMALVIFGSVRLLTERWILSGRDFDLAAEWGNVWEALKTMIVAPARRLEGLD